MSISGRLSFLSDFSQCETPNSQNQEDANGRIICDCFVTGYDFLIEGSQHCRGHNLTANRLAKTWR